LLFVSIVIADRSNLNFILIVYVVVYTLLFICSSKINIVFTNIRC